MSQITGASDDPSVSQLVFTITREKPLLGTVLNVKAVVAAFSQEKVLVGAFSVILKTDCETDGPGRVTGT